MIAGEGFAGSALEANARGADVTRGSIYSNFAGRDGLMTAAVDSQGMRIDGEFGERLPLRAEPRLSPITCRPVLVPLHDAG